MEEVSHSDNLKRANEIGGIMEKASHDTQRQSPFLHGCLTSPFLRGHVTQQIRFPRKSGKIQKKMRIWGLGRLGDHFYCKYH